MWLAGNKRVSGLRHAKAVVILLVALGVVFVACPAAQAGYITDQLGAAGPGNFAIFALGGTNLGNTDATLNGPGQTTGNVGIASVGNIALSSSTAPAIIGNLYLGNSSTTGGSASPVSGQVSGSIFVNQDAFLGTGTSTGFWTGGTTTATGAVLDALNAAKTFAGVSATTGPVISSVTAGGNTTTTWDFSGTGNTVNVLKITDLIIDDHNKLVLNGAVGQQVILDISNTINLHGSDFGGKVSLSGGLTTTGVVYNLTSTTSGDNFTSSGGSSGGLPNDFLSGIVLDVAGGVHLAPGLVFGEIIGGGNEIALVSGSQVNGPQNAPPLPEPASLALWSVLGLAGLVYRTRWAQAL